MIDFARARRNMVEHQIHCCRVLEPKIIELFETMPREEFLPEDLRSIAYMEGHIPLPCGQETLTPLQEAQILQALDLKPEDRVLEIGTGCGLLTAMLAMLAGEVISVEIHPELAELARKNLAEHGIENAKVLCLNALDEKAMDAEEALEGPFDAIVVGAAVKEVPAHWVRRLKDGGRMCVFIGENPVVHLELWTRVGEGWRKAGLMDTMLMSIEGVPKKREFVF